MRQHDSSSSTPEPTAFAPSPGVPGKRTRVLQELLGTRAQLVGAAPAAGTGAGPAVVGGAAASEVMSELTQAHGLATSAAVEAQQAIAAAMTQVMNGAANPVHLVGAILKGAITAIEGLVRTGLASALELAGSIARAAERAIQSIVDAIINFIVALLTGNLGSLGGNYERDKASIDAAFASGQQEIAATVETIKTERMAEAQQALRNGFMELGMEFVRAAGGSLAGPTQKAQQARELAAKAAARPITLPDGSVTQADPKAVSDVSQIADVVGQMSGAASASQENVAAAGRNGAGLVTSAEPGMQRGATEAQQLIKQRYEQPKAAQDERVAQSRTTGAQQASDAASE